MSDMRYLEDVVTLAYDDSKCTGCGVCVDVCPHAVFELSQRPARARVLDRDACMECGACARNCAFDAITVRPGVGCASGIIRSWFQRGSEPSCGPSGAGGAGC